MRKGGWLRVASVDVLRYVNGRGKQARSIVVRVDDLVLDCAHHLEATLVVDVAWGGTQRGGDGDGLREGRHRVDAKLRFELLEGRLAPI